MTPYSEKTEQMSAEEIKIINGKLLKRLFLSLLYVTIPLIYIYISAIAADTASFLVVLIILLIIYFNFNLLKDTAELQKKVVIGSVSSKFIEESSSGEDNNTVTSYHIKIQDFELKVNLSTYENLRVGTEVIFNLAKNSQTILSYEVLSIENEVAEDYLFSKKEVFGKSISMENKKNIKTMPLSREESAYLKALRKSHFVGSIVGFIVGFVFFTFLAFILMLISSFFPLQDYPEVKILGGIIYMIFVLRSLILYVIKANTRFSKDHRQQMKEVFESKLEENAMINFQIPTFGLIKKPSIIRKPMQGFVIKIGKESIGLKEEMFKGLEKDEAVCVHILPHSFLTLKIIKISDGQVIYDVFDQSISKKW